MMQLTRKSDSFIRLITRNERFTIQLMQTIHWYRLVFCDWTVYKYICSSTILPNNIAPGFWIFNNAFLKYSLFNTLVVLPKFYGQNIWGSLRKL